jgi:THO complex subunit 2
MYNSLCPDLKTLIHTYGLEVTHAFHILRPKFGIDVNKKDVSERKELQNLPHTQMNENDGDPSSENEMAVDTNAEESDRAPFNQVTLQIVDLNLNMSLTCRLFSIFWLTGLSDIVVPHFQYELALKNISESIISLENVKSERGGSRRKREILKLQGRKKQLNLELLCQKTHVELTINRFQIEKKSWFASDSSSDFLAYCIYPRCKISPADATFCVKFVKLIYTLGTPNFSLFNLINRLLDKGAMCALMFSMTELEAKNYGLFLCGILEMITNWHINPDKYQVDVLEAENYGFCSDLQEPVNLTYEEFRNSMYIWHSNLLHVFIV